jgi:hypothetical protein
VYAWETLAAKHGLMSAYQLFFFSADAIGISAILLFLALAAHYRATRLAPERQKQPVLP